MDKLQPLFDIIEGCDPKVSAFAGLGALIVAKFALNVSGMQLKCICNNVACGGIGIVARLCTRRLAVGASMPSEESMR